MSAYLVYNHIELVSAKSNLLAAFNKFKSLIPIAEQSKIKSYVQITRDFKRDGFIRHLTLSGHIITIKKIIIEKK